MIRLLALTFLLVLTSFLTGCATYWYQEGKTISECKLDRRKCLEELKKYSSNWSDMGSYEFDFMEDCMFEKGYRLVTEDKLPMRVRREDPAPSLHWRLHGMAGTLDE
jgi:hypothetical protein